MYSHIQDIFNEISLPVIELAGPSPRGYRLMERFNLKLPITKVTNSSREVTVYTEDDKPHDYIVDEVIDIRTWDIEDSSVGGFFCSYLPILDPEFWPGPAEGKKLLTAEYKSALAQTSLNPKDYKCLHIKLLLGVAKALAPGGVFILQGTYKGDTKLAGSLNLKPLLENKVENDIESQIYLKQKDL